MIVAFCGHADFQRSEKYELEVLQFLEKTIGNKKAELYLGGYGNFDQFAYNCAKTYKAIHTNTSIVFVTPYITPEYQKNYLEYEKEKYDNIIFPPIEDKPKKFAILYRNRYMIEKSDYVIAYINRTFGGAYKTYKYAKRKGKIIFNLTGKDFD